MSLQVQLTCCYGLLLQHSAVLGQQNVCRMNFLVIRVIHWHKYGTRMECMWQLAHSFILATNWYTDLSGLFQVLVYIQFIPGEIHLNTYCVTGTDHNSSETFERKKYLCSARRGVRMIQSIDDQTSKLRINLNRHNRFISSYCTKLAFVLLHDSVTYFSHHQGVLIFIKTQAANHTSRNFKHTCISIIQQSVDA
jgi:hypothetical protein